MFKVKLLITEVVMDEYKSVYHINIDSDRELMWQDARSEYEISESLLYNIKNHSVIGWVAGVNRFGQPVKRTYMLVPE